MKLNSCRFSGSVVVRTVGDHRSQEDYLRTQLIPKLGETVAPYLQNQQSVLELVKTVTTGSIKALMAKLASSAASPTQAPRLTLGHNLKTATIDYGENPRLRGEIHQALLAVGADFIDTDGEIFKPGFQLQLRDQFLDQFGLPLEREILRLLKEKQLTLATAESATGGLVSSRLTDIKGSSYSVQHNMVTYCNQAKTKAFGIDAGFLEKEGPYNERTAAEMAEGVLNATGAKVGIALTGLAGCNKWGDDCVGLVYIGLAGLTDKPIVKKVTVDADLPRTMKKQLFSEYGLTYLKLYLEGKLTDETANPTVAAPKA